VFDFIISHKRISIVSEIFLFLQFIVHSTSKMTNKIDIKFDGNSSGIYRPNHLACIQVELICEKAIENVKEFRIEVTGFEKTEWDNVTHLNTISFSGFHQFFNYTDVLLKGDNEKKTINIRPGTQTFRHTFRIPKEAPSSFNGQHGCIEYKIKAIVDVKISKDFVHEQKFFVFRFEDFNDYDLLRNPIEVKGNKMFGRFQRQHLKVRMSTIRDGFCIGEEIPIKLAVHNHTAFAFPETSLTFCRVEKSFGTDPFSGISVLKKIVSRATTYDIPATSMKDFEAVLKIPTNSPTTNEHLCEVFQVLYEVIYTISPKSGRIKKSNQNEDEEVPPELEIILPIYVGAVPFIKRSESNESIDEETSQHSNAIEEEEYREYIFIQN
jgi:hypothetical protein